MFASFLDISLITNLDQFKNNLVLPMDFTTFQERFYSGSIYEVKVIKNLIDYCTKEIIQEYEKELKSLFIDAA